MAIKLCLLASTLALSACAGMDEPFERPGTWHLDYANDANLRVMVADPSDLLHGKSNGLALGDTSAAAVRRLRQGRVKPLPDSELSDVRVAGGGPPAASPAVEGGTP